MIGKVSMELRSLGDPCLFRGEAMMAYRSIGVGILLVAHNVFLVSLLVSSLFDCGASSGSAGAALESNLAFEVEHMLEEVREGVEQVLVRGGVEGPESVRAAVLAAHLGGSGDSRGCSEGSAILLESSRADGLRPVMAVHELEDVGRPTAVRVPAEGERPAEEKGPVKDNQTKLPMRNNQTSHGREGDKVQREAEDEEESDRKEGLQQSPEDTEEVGPSGVNFPGGTPSGGVHGQGWHVVRGDMVG